MKKLAIFKEILLRDIPQSLFSIVFSFMIEVVGGKCSYDHWLRFSPYAYLIYDMVIYSDRKLIAKNTNLRTTFLDKMFEKEVDRYFNDKEYAIRNDDGEFLTEAITRFSSILDALSGNMSSSKYVLSSISHTRILGQPLSRHSIVAFGFAMNVNTPSDVLREVYDGFGEDCMFLQMLAFNPNTPYDILLELAELDFNYINVALIKNPSLKEEEKNMIRLRAGIV